MSVRSGSRFPAVGAGVGGLGWGELWGLYPHRRGSFTGQLARGGFQSLVAECLVHGLFTGALSPCWHTALFPPGSYLSQQPTPPPASRWGRG